MKKFFKLLLIPAGLLLLYVIMFLCIEFFYILTPSHGSKIDIKVNTNSVILIVDVQNKLTAWDNQQKAQKYKIGIFLQNINLAVKKLPNMETVYIRQEFPRNSLLSFLLPMFPEQGDPGTEINKKVYKENSRIITKSKADAFTNPSLEKYLESKKIGTLYIMGLAAEACVDRTIRGATAMGYRVYVIKEAVLSMNGGHPDNERLGRYKSYGAEIISIDDIK